LLFLVSFSCIAAIGWLCAWVERRWSSHEVHAHA
jgi:hypothetical protein